MIETVASLQPAIDSAALRVDLDRLLRQEWPYYAPSNGLALQPAPTAADLLLWQSCPRLSDALVLNFALYSLFKVIARHVPDEASREQFSQALGRRLLTAVAPQAEAAVTRAAARDRSTGGASDEALLRDAVRTLLDAFVAGGYMRSYTITWGALPSLPAVPGGVNASDSRVVLPSEDELIAGRCQIRLNGAPATLMHARMWREEVIDSADVTRPGVQPLRTWPAAAPFVLRSPAGGPVWCRSRCWPFLPHRGALAQLTNPSSRTPGTRPRSLATASCLPWATRSSAWTCRSRQTRWSWMLRTE